MGKMDLAPHQLCICGPLKPLVKFTVLPLRTDTGMIHYLLIHEYHMHIVLSTVFPYCICSDTVIPRNCEGPESICQDEEDVELQIQVIATTPKLFIVENFMSSFEADSMILQAQSNAPIDDSASVKGGGPNATRYWVKRSANDVMDTIAQRAADVLGKYLNL